MHSNKDAVIITTVKTQNSPPFYLSNGIQLHYSTLFNFPVYYLIDIDSNESGFVSIEMKNGMSTMYATIYEKIKNIKEFQ